MLRAVVIDIERYLAVNEDAVDSAEGVRGFWLAPQLRTVPLEDVITALGELEQRGVVVRRRVGTGFVYSKRTPRLRH